MSRILAMMALLLTASALAVAQGPKSGAPAGGQPPAPRRSLFGLGNKGKASAPAPRGASLTDPNVRPASGTAPAPTDPSLGNRQTFQSDSVLPEPAALENVEKPRIALPTAPIEPYLLTRKNGPFMVTAHVFRGPDAVRYAQALAMELRNQHHLPAYVFFLRIQPGHSNIRNVPPTSPEQVQGGEAVIPPEKYRMYDEAAVLVGDCKTIDESEKILHRVKKIHSVVIDGTPSIYIWRKGKGLSRATLTTNPMVASQELFPGQELTEPHPHSGEVAIRPGAVVDPSVLTASFQPVQKPDPLLKQMNAGPSSVHNCPGPYVLQVAEFLGRTTTNGSDPKLLSDGFLKQSPLAAAADRAEDLTNILNTKCKSVKGKWKAYSYHDRNSSKVFLGPFRSPTDPSLKRFLDSNKEITTELLVNKYSLLPLAPAGQLSPVPKP